MGESRPEHITNTKNNTLNATIRTGHIGDINCQWGNGFCTQCEICQVSISLLIDSGSTASILSYKTYESLPHTDRPSLNKEEASIRDVNGNKIQSYGYANFEICLGGRYYDQALVVCDINCDGILGQDFRLKYVNKINYKHMVLQTDDVEIRCFTGGNAPMIGRVQVKRSTAIPAHSDVGYQLIYQNQVVNVTNHSDCPITLQANTVIASCEPYIDQTRNTQQRVCKTILDVQNASNQEVLPEYLQDLFDRSTVNLDADQSNQLRQLLIKYQTIFSKSSEDIGCTDRVTHKINTGVATPIRQPPRRQPIGKREVEVNEINKMLDRGIIEPSASAWASPIVLVTKKDGSIRFCIDYCKVNEVTVKDAYLIA